MSLDMKKGTLKNEEVKKAIVRNTALCNVPSTLGRVKFVLNYLYDYVNGNEYALLLLVLYC